MENDFGVTTQDGNEGISKQYYWGLDLGNPEGDYGVRCVCHKDANGKLVIDRIVRDEV